MEKLLLIHSWYPGSCCGNIDCKPVPCDQIYQRADGTYIWLGHIFKAAQPSLDAMCHACISNVGEGLCLFLQFSM